jgi:hypothetical protein
MNEMIDLGLTTASFAVLFIPVRLPGTPGMNVQKERLESGSSLENLLCFSLLESIRDRCYSSRRS